MFLCLCFFAVLAMLPGPFSMREIVHNVYRQFPFYYFTEEKAQETWMEMDGETLAEIEKRNGAYLEEVAENERNLREENAKKSKEANLEKNSSVSEESKKINNTEATLINIASFYHKTKKFSTGQKEKSFEVIHNHKKRLFTL